MTGTGRFRGMEGVEGMRGIGGMKAIEIKGIGLG